MFRPTPAPAALERARLLLLAAFGLSGLMAFSWLSRIPGIRTALGLTPAELGAILLIGSAGALATVFTSALWMDRLGSGRAFAAGAVVMSAGYLMMGAGPALSSAWLFGAGIVVNGIGGSLLNVPMNLESARIEQAFGRTIIPHFHAAFSAGAVAGSLVGAGAAWFSLPVWAQFTAVGLAVGALRLLALAGGMVLPGIRRPRREPESGRRPTGLGVWLEPRTVLIGLVAFAAALSEGAANNWLGVAVVDGFAVSEATGGIALGLFIAAMTLVRVFGPRLMDRLGRVRSLQLSALAGIVGVAAFALSSTLAAAAVGVVAWGVGAGLGFPIAVAAATDDPDLAAARLSVVSSLASIAILTAAPLIGVLAGQVGGTRQALLATVALLVATLAAAPRLAPSAAKVADPLDASLELATDPQPA